MGAPDSYHPISSQTESIDKKSRPQILVNLTNESIVVAI